VLALTTGAVRAAYAANKDSPWSVSILGGDSVAVTGKLRSPATSTISDLGTVDPGLAGTSGTLSLDKLRYNDLFRSRYDTGLELDYSFDENLQSYGRFSYEGLGGRTRTMAELSTPSLTTPSSLTARFADADNMSVQLGSRYYWSTGTAWRPFAGAALGATHLDAMRASLAVPDTSLDLQNVRFTRTATVFSQSLETGVEYNPNSSSGVRFCVDADHIGTPPSARDPALTELGFDSAHDAQSRWSFPVAVAATYHFE
jgi:hypothetical protein